MWAREEDAVRYGLSGEFERLTVRLKDTFSDLYQWNIALSGDPESTADTSNRGVDVEGYPVGGRPQTQVVQEEAWIAPPDRAVLPFRKTMIRTMKVPARDRIRAEEMPHLRETTMNDAQNTNANSIRSGLLLKLDFQLPGDVESIQPAVDEIMEVVGAQECAAGIEFEVEVALLEALANAVTHGCQDDPSKIIEVCVACEIDRGMLIIVRDPGFGFRSGKIPSPVKGENVFSDHGRGIFLINQLMDDVEYRSGGTEIWMRKK